jgi:large subunit ribosomal protein L24
MSVKVNDTVMVIAGGEKSKGKTGVVIATSAKNHTVTVRGVNLVKKHEKAKKAQQVSQIVEVEAPIDVSNVMVVCPVCNKPTRVKHAIIDGKKVRVCGAKDASGKVCGGVLDKAYTKAAKKADAAKAEAPKKRTRKRTAKAEGAAEEVKE